ncbi:MAG: amidohydrolase family protein [Planctomycetota bacterium]
MSPRIDAHQHFWKLARGDYRWLRPELAPLYRDFGPQDLAPLRARHGIDGSVLMQAADSIAETEFMLALAAEDATILGVVGWVDFEAPDAPDTLARLARNPKLVGVRPMLQDIPDVRWMLRDKLAPAFRALVELNLAFDALVQPPHLPHLVRLVERWPDLRVVVDHGAKPVISAGLRWPARAAWGADLRALAAHPRLCCKLSGLVTEASPDWSDADLAPFAHELVEIFTPQRTMWGSDWPVVDLAGGYSRWYESAHALFAGLHAGERRALFGATAAEFYGLSWTPPA